MRGLQENMGTQREETDPTREKGEGSFCGWGVEASASKKKREIREVRK